jgi:hypothetical protein
MNPMLKVVLVLGLFTAATASSAVDPYTTLPSEEKALLKPQIERWIRDQLKHDWSDMWEIQDQTSRLKNELLLGRRNAPDMNRSEYIQAMRETIGIGYPEIKAFTLTEVGKEADGFQVVGCAKEQREEWHSTRIEYIHVRIEHGRTLFDLPDSSNEPCELK